MRLTFTGPEAIPPDWNRPGVYWLRIYEDPAQSVVIVTEVPANPGRSITNAASMIARHTIRRFSLDVPTRWFLCYPAGTNGIWKTTEYSGRGAPAYPQKDHLRSPRPKPLGDRDRGAQSGVSGGHVMMPLHTVQDSVVTAPLGLR
jgi:hypothetical protein